MPDAGLRVSLGRSDALIVVDVQYDFLPGGSLAVPGGDAVVPALNRYLAAFRYRGQPVFATRDWHPADHCSFRAQGGPWPPHCIAGSDGARFAALLDLPCEVRIVSKASAADRDAYSAFEGTDLAEQLRGAGASRLLIGGLATDYCVLNTVLDGLRLGFEVLLLADAIRAVDVQAGDGERAVAAMLAAGARPITFAELAA
jgi:nicotinamidase/pyrazinamidase